MTDDGRRWYYSVGGTRVGPVSLAELRRLLAAGTVARTAYVWRDGLSAWTHAEGVPELAGSFVAPAPLAAASRIEPGARPSRKQLAIGFGVAAAGAAIAAWKLLPAAPDVPADWVAFTSSNGSLAARFPNADVSEVEMPVETPYGVVPSRWFTCASDGESYIVLVIEFASAQASPDREDFARRAAESFASRLFGSRAESQSADWQGHAASRATATRSKDGVTASRRVLSAMSGTRCVVICGEAPADRLPLVDAFARTVRLL